MKKVIFSTLFLGFLYFKCLLHNRIISFNLAALLQVLIPFIVLSILFCGKRLLKIFNMFFSHTIEEKATYHSSLDTVTGLVITLPKFLNVFLVAAFVVLPKLTNFSLNSCLLIYPLLCLIIVIKTLDMIIL